MKSVAVLLSGGLDSTTAMAVAAEASALACAISVDYGQRHVRELEAAETIARHYGVEHLILDLRAWGSFLKGSALTDPGVEVPVGSYDVKTLAITVVPNRNATFLMAAVGVAEARGLAEVWTAVHAGDHAVYPDCRPEFITSAARTAELGTDGKVSIRAPFVQMSKQAIVERALALSAPLELSWSCYEGREKHCGVCGTCAERKLSFAGAGVADPTVYELDEH